MRVEQSGRCSGSACSSAIGGSPGECGFTCHDGKLQEGRQLFMGSQVGCIIADPGWRSGGGSRDHGDSAPSISLPAERS